MRRTSGFGVFFLASCLAGHVSAQQQDAMRSDVALRGSVGYSDNVGRNELNEIEAAFYDVGTLIDWARSGRRYDFAISSDIFFREYDEAAFDSQLFGDFDALLNLDLVEDRVVWTFQNRLGQGRVNELAPAAPNNRQNINDFTTGPTFTLPLGRVGQVQAQVQQSTRSFEDIEGADSDSTMYRLDYTRALSTARRIGFGVMRRTTEFEVSPVPEFDVDSYFLTFSSATLNGSLTAELGFNRIDLGIEKNEGLRTQIQLSRKIGSFSTLSISAGRQLTDNGSLLGQSNNGDIFNRVDQIAPVSDALTRTNLGTAFSVARPRTRMDISLGWTDDEFETLSQNDIQRYQLVAGYARDLSGRSSLRVEGQFMRRDFGVADQRNDEWRASLRYEVDLGNRFSLGFDYTRRSMHATNRPDFEENQYSLTLSYALLSSSSQ